MRCHHCYTQIEAKSVLTCGTLGARYITTGAAARSHKWLIDRFLKLKIGTLIVKTIVVNFSYFEISLGTGTLAHILFNRRLTEVVLLRPAICFSNVASVFLRNPLRNTKHSLYTFRISCKFRVLLISRKNKAENLFSFCANANPGVKYCEMRKKGREIPRYTLFVFRVFCDKCIASLKGTEYLLELVVD